MADHQRRPGFIESFLNDLLEDVRRRSWFRIIPIWMFLAIGLGVITGIYVPKEFIEKPEISLVYITAIVTINGLLLTLSWVSFSKVNEMATKQPIFNFLKKNKMLSGYFFHIDFIQSTQFAALSVSLLALVVFAMKGIPENICRITFGAMSSATFYALRYAAGAVRLMQDLVWYGSQIEEQDPDNARQLTVHDGRRDDGKR